jgi:hypothetical protein
MMIEQDLIITRPAKPDAMDVHPRGVHDGCEVPFGDHVFMVTALIRGFKYEICGRCGTVRISEQR